MTSTEGSLRYHLFKNHNTSEHKISCQPCNKKFISSSALLHHNKIAHLKLKDVKCSQCEFATSTNGILKSHILSQHSIDDSDKLKCRHCEYQTYDKSYLLTHEKSVHLKLKDIQCPKCDYITAAKHNLRSHILYKHTSGQRFKCQQCQYGTNINHNLKIHMKKVHEIPNTFDASSNTEETVPEHVETEKNELKLSEDTT